jgi:hypothetical protein
MSRKTVVTITGDRLMYLFRLITLVFLLLTQAVIAFAEHQFAGGE